MAKHGTTKKKPAQIAELPELNADTARPAPPAKVAGRSKRAIEPATENVAVTDPITPLLQEELQPVTEMAVKEKAKPKRAAIPKTEVPFITDYDLYLLQEGTHLRSYEKLGAHIVEGGVHFAVWAPSATKVSVVGDFNDWDGTRNPLHPRGTSGIWETMVEGAKQGALYKYEIHDAEGQLLPQKADPYAFYAECRPDTASVIWPMPRIANRLSHTAQTIHDPVSIYEVHLGSWKRAEGNRFLTYRELAEDLVPYVAEMGFSHIELLPISEHPFDGSWGYQPTSLFSPTSRYGTPEDFLAFIEAAHNAGLKVIIDWVGGHFPDDPHGLADFDGSHLYNHSDPRQGQHRDWNTLIYNYGRTEVSNFLLANALFWCERYGIDGLRVDAVASMIYLDYSRAEGEWIPNRYGGNENLEATAFLRRMNETVYEHYPNAMTVAEESTAWPQVSHPTRSGGLGFGYKWNMGWMHDTLNYMSLDPIHRKYHHHQLTFGLLYGFSENFILPLSHDEVVHGKGSLLRRMPGDDWQKFANLRAYFAFMWTHPGKKLLFMGGEFAQWDEWNHDKSLDWHLMQYEPHKGVQSLVRDLNDLYRRLPALHHYDCQQEGFEWLESDAGEDSVLSYMRKGKSSNELVVVVCNFTPVVRYDYRIPVPKAGVYYEVLNTDSDYYGGSNVGNQGESVSQNVPHHGREHSLSLTLPPLATIVLTYSRGK